MALKLITAPSVEPLTLTDAKLHCRVDGTADDALLTVLIVAARQLAEHETHRALISQTWELVLDEFPEIIPLRYPPVQAIISVKYLDLSNVQQTLDSSNWQFDNDSEPGRLLPAYGKAWPTTYPVANAVRVRYTAGFGADATSVPEGIKHWMRMAIATWYAQRESIVPGQISSLPRGHWDALLDPWRVWEIA